MENQPLGNPIDYYWAEGKLEGKQEILDKLEKLVSKGSPACYCTSHSALYLEIRQLIKENSSFSEGGE